MRTQDEIVARIRKIELDDFREYERSDLVEYLDFKHAKPFLEPGITEMEWKPADKSPREQVIEYMPLAWLRANDCQSLPASRYFNRRSIDHLRAWTWLDGNDELPDRLDKVYQCSGKPCLVLVCQAYGIDWRRYDDDRWRKDEHGPVFTAEEALKGLGITP